MVPEQFLLLLEKFLKEELNLEELTLFLSATKDPENHKILNEVIGNKLERKAYGGLSEKLTIDKMFQQMLAKVENQIKEECKVVELPSRKRLFIFSRIAAASAILFIFLGGLYFLFPEKKKVPQTVQTIHQRFKNDVAPGSQGAILTLSDGQQIILDTAHNGKIASEGNAVIIKDGNSLAYTNGNTSETAYNTMTTPKGRQFSLELADGSKVWLNAASSITYPTAFIGSERKVSITGEVYFEVAHNGKMPFVVEKGNTQVKVLGTHFNVNSYDDENSINITLLEGAVLVTSPSPSERIGVRLKPGEQVQVMANGNMQLTDNINIEQVMAWKNERFLFESTNIKTIMRQVARWYNVEVVYLAEIPYSFVANMSMNLPISELLKLLELTGGVHFKIEGNKITIMK